MTPIRAGSATKKSSSRFSAWTDCRILSGRTAQNGHSHRAGRGAQEVANQLVQAGIVGILNFAPIVLSVPEEVMVNNVNLAIELENLSYFIQE